MVATGLPTGSLGPAKGHSFGSVYQRRRSRGTGGGGGGGGEHVPPLILLEGIVSPLPGKCEKV